MNTVEFVNAQLDFFKFCHLPVCQVALHSSESLLKLCQIDAELLDVSFRCCGIQTQSKAHKALKEDLVGRSLPLQLLWVLINIMNTCYIKI